MPCKIIYVLLFFAVFSTANNYAKTEEMKIQLKEAQFQKEDFKSLLVKRSSCRNFQTKPLNLDEVAAILWAAGGKKYDAQTQATRTIPSAGATYPLEFFLVVGKDSVDKLKAGVYHYLIADHTLVMVKEGDQRAVLAQACLGQDFIQEAPINLIITAQFTRTTYRYGTRGERYVYMESGHAAQNTYLAATNLGLGTVEIGAFSDEAVKRVLNLERDYTPLIIMPVGYPAK